MQRPRYRPYVFAQAIQNSVKPGSHYDLRLSYHRNRADDYGKYPRLLLSCPYTVKSLAGQWRLRVMSTSLSRTAGKNQRPGYVSNSTKASR